ncbi:hypothetical protein SmJEL517_g02314 [Synchytrium microbalum]|uniref:G-patch domain-containing protein n=1 Tax=Synchytrium microbalum TaxID=1806994 RepID=A0A507C835_9FUNG|nr:uncharacterized protein SmJEL517_g02314 [Synchytrium microbalum]TPX35309.1 hypothetical protein SmJEL517_g02314 [Synchytrium microbalum]
MSGLGSASHEVEDEEDDYMSSSILEEATKVPVKSKPKTYSEKRRDQLLKQQLNQPAPLRVREQEARNQGLNKTIDESNKGFQMLAKLGYTKGMSLGVADSLLQPARTDPIPIVLKNDRLGIGAPTAKRPASSLEDADNEEGDNQKTQSKTRDEFRTLKNQEFINRHISSLVKRARLSCEQLDAKLGKLRNKFWVKEKVKNDDIDGRNPQEFDSIGGVKEVYSRVAYEPDVATSDDDEPEEVEGVDEDFDGLEPSQQLEQIIEYLRATHFYCIFCGDVFANQDDLAQNCPGPSEAEHEDM